MNFQKNFLFLIVLFLLFRVCVLASETNELKVEIKAYSSEIKVGEPLILKILLTCKTPSVNPKTGEIITSGGISSPYLIITKKGQEEEIKYEYQFNSINKPLPIFENGKKGLEYAGSFIAFYDQSQKCLLFNEPGVYSCYLESSRDKIKSNTVEINVRPASRQEKKALSILTGERDLMILEFDDFTFIREYPGTRERFKQLIEQCGDTMIAKMAAARLGMYLYGEYEKKRSEVNLINQEKPIELKKEAVEYLKKGLELPDEFQMRENILFMLAESEFEEEKDYLQAKSYLEEIAEKYPAGRFRETAISGIREVETEMVNDPNWKERLEQPTAKKPLGVVLPVAAAAIAGVLIAGFVLLSKKKQNPPTNQRVKN